MKASIGMGSSTAKATKRLIMETHSRVITNMANLTASAPTSGTMEPLM